MRVTFRPRPAWTACLLLLPALVCVGGPHGHDHGDHGEEHEPPSVAVTQWSSSAELFMEYPLLPAGSPGDFIVHLTVLEGFTPVREGTLTLRFVDRGGRELRVEQQAPDREGIYVPEVRFEHSGLYDFQLEFAGSGLSETFAIGPYEVIPATDHFHAVDEEEDHSGISFLKEQQWKVPFATQEARPRPVPKSVRGIGHVMPLPSHALDVVAPVGGVLRILPETAILAGTIVAQGQALVMIEPDLQDGGWPEARLRYETARRDEERAQRLLELEAISPREYEQVRGAYLALKAAWHALPEMEHDRGIVLHAPLAGAVTDWKLRGGQRVSAGEHLLTIVDRREVWLQVQVHGLDEQPLGGLERLHLTAMPTRPGRDLVKGQFALLGVGASMDPVTRTLPVNFRVLNTEEELRLGERLPVELLGATGVERVAVPREAIYDDNGMKVVFVQTGGERFEKRVVDPGSTYGGWTVLREGLDPGERVVTRGGYFIKLASTSEEIGHGHAH
jgi:membrane fusion protein, heavy metal efflux system